MPTGPQPQGVLLLGTASQNAHGPFSHRSSHYKQKRCSQKSKPFQNKSTSTSMRAALSCSSGGRERMGEAHNGPDATVGTNINQGQAQSAAQIATQSAAQSATQSATQSAAQSATQSATQSAAQSATLNATPYRGMFAWDVDGPTNTFKSYCFRLCVFFVPHFAPHLSLIHI